MIQNFQKIVSAGVLLASFAVTVQADAEGITVHDAWSRATPPGITVGVAYFVIDNKGVQDRLLRVSSPIAKQPELHVSKMQGGVMTMEELNTLEVGAHARVAFAPSGKHVMLIGLRRPLKAGDSFPLTLTFEKAGAVKTTVRVYGIGQSPGTR
jgi:copper(I)-binding protein